MSIGLNNMHTKTIEDTYVSFRTSTVALVIVGI